MISFTLFIAAVAIVGLFFGSAIIIAGYDPIYFVIGTGTVIWAWTLAWWMRRHPQERWSPRHYGFLLPGAPLLLLLLARFPVVNTKLSPEVLGADQDGWQMMAKWYVALVVASSAAAFVLPKWWRNKQEEWRRIDSIMGR